MGSRLPSLEERGDMIAVFRAMKEVDRIESEHLFVWGREAARGYQRKLKWQGLSRDFNQFVLKILMGP